jgi:hypothetical protein
MAEAPRAKVPDRGGQGRIVECETETARFEGWNRVGFFLEINWDV